MSDEPDWVAEARALCDAATPGPWEPYFTVHGEGMVVPSRMPYPSSRISDTSTSASDYGKADTAFQAAARTALPRALTALEAADALVAAAEDVLSEDRGRMRRYRTPEDLARIMAENEARMERYATALAKFKEVRR